MAYVKTVGELKKILSTLDDNTPVVARSDNFELKGSTVCGIYTTTAKFKVQKKSFVDAFDGDCYSTDVYIEDDGGQECFQVI